MKAAVIGIGSNSLRLLVAGQTNGQYAAILRDREGLRVFASLDHQFFISPDMIRKACGSVKRLQQIAQAQGADIIRLFATSAVRDAKNQREFADALFSETGLKLEIITGKREAALSFLGATGEGRTGMIDIGGGSTEIVIGQKNAIAFAASLQAGAVRLFREFPIRCSADAYRVAEAVQELLRPHLPAFAQIKTPAEWVGVGGTMTAAATCMHNVDWANHEAIEGTIAEQADVKRILETIAEMAVDERRSLGSIPPDRADIIVHGFAILLGCMESLKINQMKITERTNLDGYIKQLIKDESKSKA